MDRWPFAEVASGSPNLPGPISMLTKIADAILDSPVAKTTDVVVATGAITFPLWRARLQEWSAIAGEITPFVAITWMLIQSVCLIMRTLRSKDADG